MVRHFPSHALKLVNNWSEISLHKECIMHYFVKAILLGFYQKFFYWVWVGEILAFYSNLFCKQIMCIKEKHVLAKIALRKYYLNEFYITVLKHNFKLLVL